MTDVAAFPALARAKKLFLLRKRAARPREVDTHADSTSPRDLRSNRSAGDQDRRHEPVRAAGSDIARRCSTSLVEFCVDFDEQLRLIKSDLLLLNTSVRRECRRESLALEKLTTALLDGKVNGVEAPHIDREAVKCCRVRLYARKPRIKLRVVLLSPYKDPTNAIHQTSPTSPKTLSRAAVLAHQAVKVRVLQAYTRLYLYRRLYRGGPSQFVAAGQLTTRCRQSRAFRHWRRVVSQCAKLRMRCRRAQLHIERSAASFARSRAFKIVETEGKYAMAKEFEQSKLLAKSFHTWLGWYNG